MHGGNPKAKEVYGYTGWNKEGGYISFHNPSEKVKTYTVKLDRQLGLVSSKNRYSISSPLNNEKELVGEKIGYGQELTIVLAPGEVKVLEFK
jgi:hypothetical protein